MCSGSRAALMTGRQFNRVGVPGVFGPTVKAGLPLNETTVADQLKKAGYATVSAPPIVLTVPFFLSGSFLFFKPLFLKLMLAFFVFFFFWRKQNRQSWGSGTLANGQCSSLPHVDLTPTWGFLTLTIWVKHDEHHVRKVQTFALLYCAATPLHTQLHFLSFPPSFLIMMLIADCI